jgi:hypothetical protein
MKKAPMGEASQMIRRYEQEEEYENQEEEGRVGKEGLRIK